MQVKSKLRIVIDTNVWISGALTQHGIPALIIRFVIKNHLPVFSYATFTELKERIWRPKFDRYLTNEIRNKLLRDIESVAYWVNVYEAISIQTFCRDKDDDKFIHTALAAKAPLLITGDSDLLCIQSPINGLHIIAPYVAWNELNAKQHGIESS